MEINKIPPPEENKTLYAGLLSGGLILGIAAVVLFSDVITTFSTGIELTTILIFRLLLMLLSAYASVSCFLGIFKLMKTEKEKSKKVSEEYEDFILYARPLVEEVIRQRIVGELIIEKLEALKSVGKTRAGEEQEKTIISSPLPAWARFQLFAILLGTASVGLFVFLEAHPWELVPYSMLILSFLWYLAIGGYFGLLRDQRSYYLPLIFVALMPTLSILLRIYLQQYQVLWVVFLILGVYVFLMIAYFEYLSTGRLPFGIADLKEELKNEIVKRKISKEETIEVPEADITDLIHEIEAKKKEKMKQVLSEISMRHEIPQYEKKTEKTLMSMFFKYPLWISSIKPILIEKTLPLWLCKNGRKIYFTGILMTFLGIISLFIIPGMYEDIFLEAFFAGIIIAVAGYSIALKTGKKVFTWLSLPFLLGLLMSLGAITVLFHLSSIVSIMEEIQNIAIMYILGIMLMVLNIILEKRAGS